MARAWRLPSRVGFAAVVVIVAGVNVVMRLDTTEIEDETDAVRATVRETSGEVRDLTESDAELARSHDRTLDAIAAAEDALATAEAERRSLHEELDERRRAHDQVEQRLHERAAEVDSAEHRVGANTTLITDLERCLDDATKAANALAVGDVFGAFEALDAASGPCDRVGIAIR